MGLVTASPLCQTLEDWILQTILKVWKELLLILLATSPPVYVLWFQNHSLYLLEKLLPLEILQVIALLLLTTLSAIAFLIYLYIKSKKKYPFYPELGLKGDLEKCLWFCPKCSHPMRLEKDNMFCAPCDLKFNLPNKETSRMIWGVTNQKRINL